MTHLRESALQRAIIAALEARGCYVVNVVVAGRTGTPDLIVCHEGHYIALEVKLPKQQPTAIQLVERQRVLRANGAHAVVKSVEEAVAMLQASTGTAPP